MFAMASRGLSTPAVFREFDRLAEGRQVPEPVASQELIAALAKGDADALAATVTNDLQPAALSLFPELAGTLAAGREAGALAALVSGSGPTTAFLVRDPESAAAVERALAASGTCRSVRTASGPAPGATVTGR
ncbi:4-diphosphocytidyl-2C-methyl-D-erythritol kinase [Streptomyces calvus]